ncbi:hypothetical protein RS030_111726 [Cryptosporidium xiaoi]|uniref:Uncharacterized protein n=1 Tax=Cryptosporidium xiaoi TaxID=659607 RepID=A0AAV9Y372_9CRYT
MGIKEERSNKKKRPHLNSNLHLFNSTETQVESKRIRVPFQRSASDDKENKYSKCHMLLNDRLNSIFQNNEYCRRQVADDLFKILKSNPEVIHENIDRVISTISTCWVDVDSQVRKLTYKITLELLNSGNIRFVSPFSDFLYMQIKNTLSHVRSDIRLDGLSFLNDYLFSDFGGYKKKFINLKYILGWSPLVCRIANTDLCRTFNGMYIVISIVREIVRQIFLNTENDEFFLYANLSSIKSITTQLYDIIINLSFEVISKREQKYDNISTSIFNINGNKREKNEKYGIKIKRTLIPNIPPDIPNDLDSIMSFLTSSVLITLYYISKLGFDFDSNLSKVIKILNSFKKLHKEIVSNSTFEEKESIFLIESLSLIKLFSSHVAYIITEQNVIINDFVHLFYEFIKKYLYFGNYYKKDLFGENQSNIFHRVFLLEIETMNINFEETSSIKEFCTPEKYIFFELLNVVLNLQKIIFSSKNPNFNDLEINNPFTKEDVDQINNLLCKSSISLDLSCEKMKFGDIILSLLIVIFVGKDEWIYNNKQFTIFIFNTLIIFPLIFNKIGYRQEYIFYGKYSHWNILEGIMFYTNSQCLNLTRKNEPTKNEILLARLFISRVPKLIYILFNLSINERKKLPINIICNLFTVICDYFTDNMACSVKDESLSLDVSKGLMSLFIISIKFPNNEQCSIISYLPFKIQKKIISTIPNWTTISNKFISLILKEVLSFLKNKTKISFSFYVLKTLISGTDDLLLSLEMKMSIISKIVNCCECSNILKFQLFSTISESLIRLFEAYFYSPNEKRGLFYLFFKYWFVPLNEKLKILYDSTNFQENTLIFLITVVSKISDFPTDLSIREGKISHKILIPEVLSYIIYNSVGKFFYLDYPLNFIEIANINFIYDTLIIDYSNFMGERRIEEIKKIFPVEKLRHPIYYIILTFRSSGCFFNEDDLIYSESFRFNSIASILDYVLEKHLNKNEKITKKEYNNISIFTLISLWWLSISNLFHNYIMERKDLIKLIEEFFQKNNQHEYMIIFNHIQNKIQTVK